MRLEGVELIFSLPGESRTLDVGSVRISVDDILKAMPPGTASYDRNVVPLDGNYTTVMFNTTA